MQAAALRKLGFFGGSKPQHQSYIDIHVLECNKTNFVLLLSKSVLRNKVNSSSEMHLTRIYIKSLEARTNRKQEHKGPPKTTRTNLLGDVGHGCARKNIARNWHLKLYNPEHFNF